MRVAILKAVASQGGSRCEQSGQGQVGVTLIARQVMWCPSYRVGSAVNDRLVFCAVCPDAAHFVSCPTNRMRSVKGQGYFVTLLDYGR